MDIIKELMKSKLFIWWLVLKLLISWFFAWILFLDWFLPFVDYFSSSFFSNPYNYFYNIWDTAAFPYSSVMLWFVSIFYSVVAWTDIQFLQIFSIKLSLLVADLTILMILLKWFPIYKKRILIYYWLSPILIFISYFYGQLDVIPTAILFVSIFFLFRKKYLISILVYWIWVATKTHLLLALPLILLYMYNKKVDKVKIVLYTVLSLFMAFLLLLPYIFSEWYHYLVLQNSEQIKVFSLLIDYNLNNLKIFVVPGIYVALLLMFPLIKRMNQDYLMIYIWIVFSLMIILVPPKFSWFFWSIPFVIYFYIKYKNTPILNYLSLNIFYFLFFLFERDSDFLSIFGYISKDISVISLNNLFFDIQTWILLQNVLFSVLVVTSIATVIQIYKIWIASNKEYKQNNKSFLIWIWWDSWAWKSTLVNNIISMFDNSNINLLEWDDIHKWPRWDTNWKKFTHLDPKSNRLHMDLKHAELLRLWKTVKRKHYDHSTWKFTEAKNVESSKFLIFAWLHPFFLSQMRKIIDFKIFMKPDEDLRMHWKIVRDMQKRWYKKEKVIEQIKLREEDSKKYINTQAKYADMIISFFPTVAIKDIWSQKEKVDLSLKLEFHNSYYMEDLIDDLVQNTNLDIKHYMAHDLENQICEINWNISVKQLQYALLNHIPNFLSITWKNEIIFDIWLNGIVQLFTLYIIHEQMRNDDNDNSFTN